MRVRWPLDVGRGATELPRGPEIRHLAALVAVAGERSLNAAVRRLGYAQSTLRQHLTELERVAGIRLLDRRGGTGTAALTEAGRLLLQHAEAVVARVVAARADIEAMGRAESLRIGVPESVAVGVVRAVLEAQSDTSVTATLASDDGEAVDQLVAGQVDLSLVTLPAPAGPIAFVTLLDEPYVLLMPAGFELPNPPAKPPRGLVPLIACRRSSHGARAENALAAAGWRFDVVRYAATDAAVHAFVSGGAGVAVLPRWSVDLDTPGIEVAELSKAIPPCRLALAWHRYRRLPPAADRFRQGALEACAGLTRPAAV
jgi:DNA-binding transcriptional LysR family regulator